MFTPIDVLESDLHSIGFESKVPQYEHCVLSGVEGPIADSPIGYYRFHYWINSDTSKEHENIVFVGKHASFVCVSMIQEKSHSVDETFYRVLIRSAMGWKSCIVYLKDLELSSNSSNRTLVLKEVMRRYCDTVFYSSTHSATLTTSELGSPLDMHSIGINSFDEKAPKDSNVSRNSSLNSIKSNFTLSALRASFAGSQDSISVSKFGSFSSLSDLVCGGGEEEAEEEFDSEKIKEIVYDLNNRFFKSANLIKDKEFSAKLLELEKSLTPTNFNFDIINLTQESDTESFKKFQNALGDEINRKENNDYVKMLSEKITLFAETETSTAVRTQEKAVVLSPKTETETEPEFTEDKNKVEVGQEHNKSPEDTKQGKLIYNITEFLEKERNYVRQLKLIQKVFINYLKNDDSGKYILKLKDYKDIFDGIVEYIPIHENLLSDLSTDDSVEHFISTLKTFVESKKLYSYQQYFLGYEKRCQALKRCLDTNEKFFNFHEQCTHENPDFNRQGLDQLIAAPIQRVPRYSMHCRDILKNSQKIEFEATLEEMEKTVRFMDTAKLKAHQTEMLFKMQRKINNFPPDFLRADRNFITKIACFLTDAGNSKISKTRYTIYLCNDLVLFAKKRPSSFTGDLITHDFVFAIDIKHVQFNQSRGKKAEKMYFSSELDIDHTLFTNNLSEIDSALFGKNRTTPSSSVSSNTGTISTNYKFLPKNQKKLTPFLSEFAEARSQFILSESPAKLRKRQLDGRDLSYHIFNSQDYEDWENKSRVAIVYTEEDEGTNLNHFLSNYLNDYAAVAIVQQKSNKFRFCLRTKNSLNLADCKFIQTSTDLKSIDQFMKEFHSAILNAHLLSSLYPPFSKNILQQQRFVLESVYAASKPSGFSIISKSSGLKSFLSSFTSSGSSSDKSNGDRLSRGTSLKTNSSPLAPTPSKQQADEIKKELKMDVSMSLLHL